jgi:hypothetical protein
MLAIWLAALWFIFLLLQFNSRFLARRRFRLGESKTAIGGDGLKSSVGR